MEGRHTSYIKWRNSHRQFGKCFSAPSGFKKVTYPKVSKGANGYINARYRYAGERAPSLNQLQVMAGPQETYHDRPDSHLTRSDQTCTYLFMARGVP